MASTITLLRRIKTAQNVSKTTRAMQMIAASKLKKAQDAALTSRPYVEKLSFVSKHLSKRVDKPSLPAYMKASNATGKKLIVAISPDKGLCGGLITNLAREVLLATTKNDKIITVGKKIEGPVSRLGEQLIASFPFGNTLPAFSVVYPIIEIINEQFISGKVDQVEIISTHFENIFTQKPKVVKLLPLLPEDMADPSAGSGQEKEKNLSDAFQLFEPDLETILPDLLKRYIEMVLYQEILESYLSEQSARMLAMQNATTNARDIIEDLKLEYNKTRQAKITSEILDITSGAAAK